jgi:hypothetical protein
MSAILLDYRFQVMAAVKRSVLALIHPDGVMARPALW